MSASSLVVFDAAKFYANSDLRVAADGLPGCMGDKDDTECAPLYNTLGVVPWDDSTRITQTAFLLATGTRFSPSTSTGGGASRKDPHDPVAWPDPDYQRPATLNVANVSKAGETRSHPAGDARYNVNCMRCHQEKGPGIGMFTAAGTLVDSMSKPASTAKVELFSGTVVGYGMFEDIVSQAVLEVDGNGNFFTTSPLPLDTTELSARVLNSAGEVLMTMPFTQQTAACNNCHTGGFRLTLPAAPATP